tara:strand:+ start:382 stop:726 length:345 start_codon:yes stop_codon:yes gene_type:complete
MRDNYRVNKYNTLAKVKPQVSHNSLGECISIKKENNKMSNDIREYDDMIVVEVKAEISIKVTENELELFEGLWDSTKKAEFIEEMFGKVGFQPNERIDSVNLNLITGMPLHNIG